MIYDITPVNNYTGNNSTTTFEFNFYIENEEQLKVTLCNNQNIQYTLQNGIDYSINELKNKNGSYITFPLSTSEHNILSENEKISLELTLPISQETQYNNSSLLNLEALEYSFDYLTRLIQILSRKQELSIKVSEFSNVTPEELYNELNSSKTFVNEAAEDINKKYDELNSIYEDIIKYNDKFNQIDINTSEISALNTNLNNKLDKNLSNVSLSGKEEITNLCLPDYNSGIDITSNLKTPPYSYTPPTNGVIRFMVRGNVEWIIVNTASAPEDNSSSNLVNINAGDSIIITTLLQVEKNKTIYDIGVHDGTSAIFYPLKGVEND